MELVEKWKGEKLTDNSKIEYCKQCKNCIFRSDGTVHTNNYQKACCMMYPHPNRKPLDVIDNVGKCEHYIGDNGE